MMRNDADLKCITKTREANSNNRKKYKNEKGKQAYYYCWVVRAPPSKDNTKLLITDQCATIFLHSKLNRDACKVRIDPSMANLPKIKVTICNMFLWMPPSQQTSYLSFFLHTFGFNFSPHKIS